MINRNEAYRTVGPVQFRVLETINEADIFDTYCKEITRRLNGYFGYRVPDSQISLALRRLREHGLITYRNIPGRKPKKRGRPRVYYRLTRHGKRALRHNGRYKVERKS